ncbi:T9SS type A sorting domain-containing protein [Sediminibacter sp. Hel_I_10]|uniref:T9SS type A sorting domain-containing protein n=1 Tax=Sediminibacter sp. Hel_I_10 TaxID=1392490 RepID=UPI00047D9A37|nr:T9SS type A sorting domain-containing protein [Sediminibacter sp. Hel_I_10]
MRKITFTVLTLFLFGNAFSQAPIFDPSMTVTGYLTINSPSSEGIDKIIDGNITTKFLDFDEDDGAGFIVDLGGTSELAQSIDITTANDEPTRDPTSVEIAGSIDGTNFTSIATIDIPCIEDRFFTRTFDFDNTNPYSYYRINFIQECNNTASMIQVAEVQLFDAPQLSAHTFELEQQFRIVPNPSHGIFKVSAPQDLVIKNVSIYDVTGKLVLVAHAETEVNASELAKGLYLVKISSEIGTISKRIVIE